jgi:hypothetical protein
MGEHTKRIIHIGLNGPSDGYRKDMGSARTLPVPIGEVEVPVQSYFDQLTVSRVKQLLSILSVRSTNDEKRARRSTSNLYQIVQKQPAAFSDTLTWKPRHDLRRRNSD